MLNRFISITCFILGASLCTSTSIMTISYILLCVLVFFTPNFLQKLKLSLNQPFIIGCLIFYATFVLASLWSSAPIYDITTMLRHIIEYLVAPLLFIGFQTNNSGKLFLRGLLFGGLLSAVLSIISCLFKTPILYGVRDTVFLSYNSYVVFHGHILHNAFLAVISCMVLWLIFDREIKHKQRLWLIIFYLICFFDVNFIVVGRTGQVMLLLGNLITLIYRFRLKGIILSVIVLMTVIPILYLSPAIQKGVKAYNNDMTEYNKYSNFHTSMGARITFHNVSKTLIKEKPILGYGTGNFSHVYADYTKKNNILVSTVNPHNDIFWIAIETGIFGVAGFILMVLLSLINLRKLNKFYVCSGLCLIITYLSASTQNSFFIDNVTGFFFVLVLLGLISIGNKTNNYHPLSLFCFKDLK